MGGKTIQGYSKGALMCSGGLFEIPRQKYVAAVAAGNSHTKSCLWKQLPSLFSPILALCSKGGTKTDNVDCVSACTPKQQSDMLKRSICGTWWSNL